MTLMSIFSSISSSITSTSLASFLQTLCGIYKPALKENWLLTLAKEAVSNDSKSVLKEEFLNDISRLVEVCFGEERTEKNLQKYAIKLEKAFAEKRACSFHYFAITKGNHGRNLSLAVRATATMKPLIICCSRFFSTFGLPIVAVILILLKKAKVLNILLLVIKRVIKRVRDTLVKGKD